MTTATMSTETSIDVDFVSLLADALEKQVVTSTELAEKYSLMTPAIHTWLSGDDVPLPALQTSISEYIRSKTKRRCE